MAYQCGSLIASLDISSDDATSVEEQAFGQILMTQKIAIQTLERETGFEFLWYQQEKLGNSSQQKI